MKKLTFYLVALFCGLFIVAGLSSCLGDDSEDYTIDATTHNTYLTRIAMAGSKSYTVRCYYPVSVYGTTMGVKYDSLRGVGCNFTARDSSFTVSNFPVCALDSAVKVDSTVTEGTYRELFNALHKSSATVNLKGAYYIPNSQYIQDSYTQFLMGALAETTLTYGGQEHNVAFYFSPYYSYGYYVGSSMSCQFQLYLSSILLDYNASTGKGTTLSESNFRNVNLVFQ